MDTELDVSQNFVHKASEFLGNKIAAAVLSKTLATRTKSNGISIGKQEPSEEITIPSEKIEETLNKLRQAL